MSRIRIRIIFEGHFIRIFEYSNIHAHHCPIPTKLGRKLKLQQNAPPPLDYILICDKMKCVIMWNRAIYFILKTGMRQWGNYAVRQWGSEALSEGVRQWGSEAVGQWDSEAVRPCSVVFTLRGQPEEYGHTLEVDDHKEVDFRR